MQKHPAYPVVLPAPGIRGTAMALHIPSDARELAERFLQSLGTSLDATHHRMLDIRESPAAPELMVATKKMQQQLHPDTRNLITWANNTYEVDACDYPTVKEAEDLLDDFYKRWRQTRTT